MKQRKDLRVAIIASVLVLSPIILFVGWFSYGVYFEETVLLESNSPNDINTIKIVEKGSPILFGDSSVRIKYSSWKHLDKNISDDGATLDSSNATIEWENDNEAMITLYGSEQRAEFVKIKIE